MSLSFVETALKLSIKIILFTSVYSILCCHFSFQRCLWMRSLMVWTPEEYSNSILDPLIVLWSAPLLYASSLLIFSISVFLCFITSAWFCLLDECVDHRVTVSRSHGHSNKSIRFGNFTGWCPVFGACSVTDLGVVTLREKGVFQSCLASLVISLLAWV